MRFVVCLLVFAALLIKSLRGCNFLVPCDYDCRMSGNTISWLNEIMTEGPASDPGIKVREEEISPKFRGFVDYHETSEDSSINDNVVFFPEFRPDWTEETNRDVGKSSQVENSDDENDLFGEDNSANNIKNELMDNDETVEVDVQIDETDDNERLLSTVNPQSLASMRLNRMLGLISGLNTIIEQYNKPNLYDNDN